MERPDSSPELVESPESVCRLLHEIEPVSRIAVDFESNGMFAYRGRVCVAQLAWMTDRGIARVAIIDTLAIPLSHLSSLLSNPRVLKVIHDLAFDARILAAESVYLRGVRDTSVAASYLGKHETGLASLLRTELGVHVSKDKQNSDWSIRPFTAESLAYLAGDVQHLLALDSTLTRQVETAQIVDEVATETAYRLVNALDATEQPTEPHLRIHGTHHLDSVGWRVLEAIAQTREHLAREKNLPPQRILGDRLLIAIAQRKPTTPAELSHYRPVGKLPSHERAALLHAITKAITSNNEPSNERHATPNPIPPAVRATRKGLENRLREWRRTEAAQRQVNEQAILPSHCIRRIVDSPPHTPEQLAALPGFGPSRTKRYASVVLGLVAV